MWFLQLITLSSAIPLPESSDCSLSDIMEKSSPGHTGDTVSDSESSTKFASCKVLHNTLLDIAEKKKSHALENRQLGEIDTRKSGSW